MSLSTERLLKTLRCPGCNGFLRVNDENVKTNGDLCFECANCSERFPVISEVPRLLLSPLRKALLGNKESDDSPGPQVKTALSFGFEWTRFPEMYEEWGRSFLD